MNPLALASAASDDAHCSSLPRTETKILASRRSLVVSTSVTVTNPRRGSLSSRCSKSETSSLMSWLMRSRRLACITWPASPELHRPVDHVALEVLLHEVHHLVDHLVGVPRVVRDARDGEGRALPGVVMVHLGDRDVEAPPHLVLQALEDVALALERADLREVELEDAEPHARGRHAPIRSAAGRRRPTAEGTARQPASSAPYRVRAT